MWTYILHRLLQMGVVMALLSFVLVALLRLMPGDPVELMISTNPNMKPSDVQRLRAYYGLDDPLPVFYAKQMRKYVVEHDLGYSRKARGVPVKDMISGRIVNTLKLTALALTLSLFVAVPAGVYAAVRQYSWFDYLVNGMAFVGISIPSFWLALMLILVFASGLGWLPAGQMTSGDGGIVDQLRHMVLPTLALSTLTIGTWTRYMRSSMLEVVKLDYVRTARAKGLSPDDVIWKHAFKNALIPLITILGLSIPALFSGALITETIFAWPGMGRLLFESVVERDYNVAIVAFMLLAFLTLLFNLFADVCYALVDPRIRLS